MTDPALLHRILINLVGNAVRHTHSGGILVTCRRGTHHARIEVWDTGPGIPPEARATIFDELVQLDNPERDPEKELGLGLAITRKSANLLGHPLALCSRMNHGSRFSLTVPLTAPDTPEVAVEDKALPGPQTLLLIGPATTEVEELAALLESWHFTVERVPDTPTARAWIASASAPQLVILDLPAGAAGVEHGLAWLNSIAADLGLILPALIVSSGPVPALGEQPGKIPRLLLTRPFRPARLRALISRLVIHPDDLPD